MLASSFMVGRALSSYPWGKIADVYGRKFVLVVSLVNSIIFSVLFGLSTSFAEALIVRFFMGLGNGVMLIARTAVSELAKGDHELESKGMGMVMSMVGVSYFFFFCIANLQTEISITIKCVTITHNFSPLAYFDNTTVRDAHQPCCGRCPQ